MIRVRSSRMRMEGRAAPVRGLRTRGAEVQSCSRSAAAGLVRHALIVQPRVCVLRVRSCNRGLLSLRELPLWRRGLRCLANNLHPLLREEGPPEVLLLTLGHLERVASPEARKGRSSRGTAQARSAPRICPSTFRSLQARQSDRHRFPYEESDDA